MNAFFSFRLRAGLVAALLGLSACVSDADPRDEDDDRRDGSADARDGAADARFDSADISAEPDAAADSADAGPSDGVRDPALPDSPMDTADARTDASDVASDIVADVGSDVAIDRGADITDTGTTPDTFDGARPDTRDAASPSDVNDAGIDVTLDVTADGAADGGSIDVTDATSDGAIDDAGDASADTGGGVDARPDAIDAGGSIFWEEHFDSGLGSFSSPVAVCGVTIPDWTNASGYAHASEPANYGVSRISSPTVTVPPNTSNVTLRMSHRFNIEEGWDCAQLLVSKNGGAAIQVTTFIAGSYTNGGAINAATCQLADMERQYPGWSGDQAEMISAVNLSAAPFSVVPGDTIGITFRMATDALTGGSGWDINWVTLSASSP
jgi:hypothetical protein